MRAAVLLDEAAEGIDLRADRHAGNMVAADREFGLQRPGFGLAVIDLMEVAVDAVPRVAGDDVDIAWHSITACSPVAIGSRRHLDPFAGLAAIGAGLLIKRCFSTVAGMAVIDLSFSPANSGSLVASAMTSPQNL